MRATLSLKVLLVDRAIRMSHIGIVTTGPSANSIRACGSARVEVRLSREVLV